MIAGPEIQPARQLLADQRRIAAGDAVPDVGGVVEQRPVAAIRRVVGEADQAAPLLKILDASPLFEASEFVSPPSRAQGMERFSIRLRRTGGAR